LPTLPSSSSAEVRGNARFDSSDVLGTS